MDAECNFEGGKTGGWGLGSMDLKGFDGARLEGVTALLKSDVRIFRYG